MKKQIYLVSLITCLSCFLLLNSNLVLAEEPLNEDDLFSGEETVVDSQEVINNGADEELKQKRIGFSGEISSNSTYTSYSTGYTPDDEKVDNQITADFYLDIRLTGGVKSFLSVEANYYPEGKEEYTTITLNEDTPPLGEKGDEIKLSSKKYTDLEFKEFFVDTNWHNKVYFRTGKQVLKWGRSYYWNPTDLINIERKDFFDMDKSREGAYGVKVHIPSGAKRNGYFFIKMDDSGDDQTETLEDISLTGKYEFLVGNTEMSFSAWAKENNKPVFGYDISSRVFGLDIRGELSVSNADLYYKMDYDTLELEKENGEAIPRASLGFTKYFDHGEINDRISITGEFYYNGNGYEKNIFEKIKTASEDQQILFLDKVYQPYMNSKYYFAVFTSVNKFLDPDLTLNINAITNLIDHSGTVTCGISYNPYLTDFYVNLDLNGFFGDDNAEAKLNGEKASASLGLKVLF